MANPPGRFRWFDSSPDVIRLVVTMYVRYPRSLQNIEDLLFEGGIDFAMGRCGFGGVGLAQCSPRRSCGRGWTLFALTGDGISTRSTARCIASSVVDHEGEVLESYATKTRDTAAALTFIKKAMKRRGWPMVIVTDGLRYCVWFFGDPVRAGLSLARIHTKPVGHPARH